MTESTGRGAEKYANQNFYEYGKRLKKNAPRGARCVCGSAEVRKYSPQVTPQLYRKSMHAYKRPLTKWIGSMSGPVQVR